MKPLHVKTASEQIADYLRDGILGRTWTDTMPGEGILAAELGIGRDTIKAAMIQLEQEKLLRSHGVGRRRRIVMPKEAAPKTLHVRILLYEPADGGAQHIIRLRHRLQLAGHSVSFTPKALTELHHSVERVERMVRANPADAWIVVTGSKPVLEWFSQSGIPAFALFGRMTGLPIAGGGPDKAPALCALAHRLLELGHHRIVMLVREDRRKPYPGPGENLFLDELKGGGVKIGSYNLPDWEDHPKGLQCCLESLFRLTPPTALFLDAPLLYHAVQHFLARHPDYKLQKVSLFCSDYDPTFEWCHPSVAHFHYDLMPVVRRVVRWVNKTARGEEDRRQTFTKVRFVDGETLRPVAVAK